MAPDEDGGNPLVAGKVCFADGDTIAILRDDHRVDRVCVHFPRVGYRVIVV